MMLGFWETIASRLAGTRAAARRKLGDSSGASIVLSVVVFGISAIFCVALVNAALSSAGNATDQAADEQDFLAASSAAKLLQDIVPGKAVTLIPTEGKCQVSETGGAQAVLQAMGDSLLSGDKTKVAFSAGDHVPAVTVTFDKNGSYDITALVRGDEKGNALAVYFKGVGEKVGTDTRVTWSVDGVGKRPAE